jgi:hypothetical protein
MASEHDKDSGAATPDHAGSLDNSNTTATTTSKKRQRKSTPIVGQKHGMTSSSSLSTDPSNQSALTASTSTRHTYRDDCTYNDMEDDISPAPYRYQSDYYGPLRASSTLRHVQRVSKRAALASKKVIWDSNDNAIGAAQSAVDQWEEAYNALRGLLVASVQSAKGVYGAAKAGANGLEHGILLPVRDFVLLPAFVGAERATERTIAFFQSDQAIQAALHCLNLARQVPWIGATVLAPSMVLSVQILQTCWEIAKYPIPSRRQVRNSVDFVLTGTKWAISTAVREVFLYMKRADAVITRTLSHTQWKVLGSGPYETLDKLNKQEVIDHLCERYFSLKGNLARYELAAHIRAHNLPLYLDLVLTGLLRERGRELTKDDEWLSSCPSYRKNAKSPFLLPNYDFEGNIDEENSDPEAALSQKESALWFRLPYINGKRPGRDTPWVRFEGQDRQSLEQRFIELYKEGRVKSRNDNGNSSNPQAPLDSHVLVESGLERPATPGDSLQNKCKPQSGQSGGTGEPVNDMDVSSRYPTIAQWHVPDPSKDIMVDQRRHSVSFLSCCPRCRQKHDPGLISNEELLHPPMQLPKYGDLCQECVESKAAFRNYWMASSILSPPPLSMVMRPNFWRFHGPGDDVRRGVWFLDTRRHGLQPYGESSSAILEDAYLFLKWRNQQLKEGSYESGKKEPRQPLLENTCREDGKNVDDRDEEGRDDDPMGENALLTVQVESPDGSEQQLVQFSSLMAATAIQKGTSQRTPFTTC